MKLPSTNILGVNVSTASKSEILEFTVEKLKKKNDKFYIVTPNPEIIVRSVSSKEYRDILNAAEVSLADGMGVLLAGSILKKHGLKRITGVEMMEEICHKASIYGFNVGFLGGRNGVAEKTSKCLQKKYPNLRVIFAGEEWLDEKMGFSNELTITKFRGKGDFGQYSSRKNIDILFVAFGAPKQEEWIAKNLPNIPVTAAMGVGGAFDFISGKVPRAPKIVRNIGMEWFYRLLIEPWRWKRQTALIKFIQLVLMEKLNGKTPHSQ